MRKSVVCFLERVKETFSQANGPALGWSSHHRTNLIESVVKGVSNRRLADSIAIPFSVINFQDVVVQSAQRVPNIAPKKLEGNMFGGNCFICRKRGHIARDCLQKWEPPICYRCNTVCHFATNNRVHDVFCQICKNNKHVTDACYTKQSPI